MIPESRIRRRLPLGIIPWNPDDPELQQAIPGAIMRAPLPAEEPAPVVRPATIPVPAVNLVNDPTAIVPEPTAPLAPITRPVIDAGTMPLTLPVNRGERPKRLPGLAPSDELQGEQDYSRAVDRFEPRKRGWKSRLPFIALSALQGLGQGGLGGAIGGALMGTGIAAFNPKIGDQTWKQRQLGESQDRLGQIREASRGALRDKLLQAQVDETTAQADERRRGKLPTARNVQTGKALLPDGRAIQMERDETGQWKPSTGPDGQPLVVAPPPKESRKIAVDVPGIGQLEVSPEAALGFYGARENRENAVLTKEGEREAKRLAAEAKLRQLSADETAAQVEKDRAYKYLADLKGNSLATKEDIAQATAEAQKANDFYRGFGQEKAKTQAELTEYAPRPTRGSLPTRKLPADLEAKIRAAAKAKGLSPDIAVERAQSRY